MADPLLSALLGQSASERLANDPFYVGGIGIQKQQIAPRNNTEAFLIPALQGLAGGAMQGYGRSNVAESMASNPLIEALKIDRSTLDTSDPFKVETALSQALLGQQLGQAQQKLNNDLYATNIDALTKADPDRAVELIQKALGLQTPASNLPQTSVATPEQPKMTDSDSSGLPAWAQEQPAPPVAAQQVPTQSAGIDTRGVPNPNSPRVRALLKEEDDARAEISKLPSVTQFKMMEKSLPLVAGFKDQDSKSSDVGFVYNYVKSLDDGAVRGEEINMAQSSNPLIQQYRGILEGALTGQSVLTPTLKNQMYKELKIAQKNVYAQALTDAKMRFEIAKGRGVTDFKNVINFDPNLTFEDDSSILSQAGSSIPEGAQPTDKTSGGKPVYLVNGKYWVPD